jgi:hypothetical protein
MPELFPVAAGLVAGAVVAWVPALRRRRLTWLAALVLGLTATVVSGESRVSWAYLLVDVPLVAVSCLLGTALTRRVTPAPPGHRPPR